MSVDNKIISKETSLDKSESEDKLMNQLLIKEIKNKINNSIDKNDPSFIKTLKTMLIDDGTKKKKQSLKNQL